jgi:putative oxidoreductase
MSTLTHDGSFATDRADARVTTATDWALLVLRLALGIIFVAHGAQKVFGWFGGHGLDATVAGFGKMGIPAPMAYLAAFTELLGGAAVLLGVLTRLASLGLAVTMVVAMAMVHLKNGFFMNGPGGPGIEYNVALLAMSVALMIAGPGRLAVGDHERKFLRRGEGTDSLS